MRFSQTGHHRTRLRWTLPLLLAFAAVAAAARSTAGSGAAAAATPGCDRFTLEKIPLDATREEVEALGVGKIEPLLVGTEESSFRVRPPKSKKEIGVQLFHGRVRDVTLFVYANAPTAETMLADLRGRWGEPNKPGDDEIKLDANWAKSLKYATWSDRSCPAYGGFVSNGLYVSVVLSTSISRVQRLPADRPADAR